MSSQAKKKAMRILKQELEDLQKDPIVTLGVVVGQLKDVFHWQMTMLGPQDTPYANGLFYLRATFPEDYPKHGPKIKFLNKMYHLNVSDSGDICINTLSEWKEGTTMAEVLSLIFALFYRQNPNNPYDNEKANLFKNNRNKFDANVREYTRKYANIEADCPQCNE